MAACPLGLLGRLFLARAFCGCRRSRLVAASASARRGQGQGLANGRLRARPCFIRFGWTSDSVRARVGFRGSWEDGVGLPVNVNRLAAPADGHGVRSETMSSLRRSRRIAVTVSKFWARFESTRVKPMGSDVCSFPSTSLFRCPQITVYVCSAVPCMQEEALYIWAATAKWSWEGTAWHGWQNGRSGMSVAARKWVPFASLGALRTLCDVRFALVRLVKGHVS